MPGNVVVFKPGYLAYPPLGSNQEERKSYMPDFTGDEFTDSRQYNLIKLGRPENLMEQKLTLGGATLFDFNRAYSKLPLLLKLHNEERKNLGLTGKIGPLKKRRE